MKVLLVPPASIAERLDEVAGRLRQGGLEVTIADFAILETPEAAGFDLIAGPGTMPLDAALMDRCPRLKGAVSVGVGCEGFDRAAAQARGIAIATGMTREAAAGMAGATIMLMLALCHDLPGAMRALAEGGRRNSEAARTLDDATVGVIGYGAIGREVARRLRAWDIRVLVSSRSLGHGEPEDRIEAVSLERLLAESDIVTLHAAHRRGAPPVLGAAELASMKRGALLVNTARGGLVDEAALAEALVAGRIGGAALDCFVEEPLPPGSPLRSAPNTILTPHQIGHTAGGSDKMARGFADNILRLAAQAAAQGTSQ